MYIKIIHLVTIIQEFGPLISQHIIKNLIKKKIQHNSNKLDKISETHADCTQSARMDFANKNCENCTQDIYEKAFRDLGSGFMTIG